MAAGQIHGSRLLTEGVDVVYERDPANLSRLAEYLHRTNARLSESTARHFSQDSLITEKGLSLCTIEGDMKVLYRIDGVGAYEDLLAMSQPCFLGNVTVRVITLDGLLLSKHVTDRPKDRLHIPDLECLRVLRLWPGV